MIDVKQLHGTEDELYRLVAPLVMNPAVLKQNYNFPFRTTERFEWFIGLDEEEHIWGFIPVECKRAECVINNYYIVNRDAEILAILMKKVLEVFSDKVLAAVAFLEDEENFRQLGFTVEKRWTRYVRMRKEPVHAEG